MMLDSIHFMPAFQRYPDEGAIVGRILVGYGEIEYELASVLGAAIADEAAALRALYRLRSEANRFEVADAIARPRFSEEGLKKEYDQSFEAVKHCRDIRNQYAHCHWANDWEGVTGLFFINFEESAKKRDAQITSPIRGVNLGLLQEQETYFVYAQSCLWFLDHEIKLRTKLLRANPFEMPKRIDPPPRYSSSTTQPPWE